MNMPTAVLDLDWEDLPPQIVGLERYSRALILLRLLGRPVGQVYLSVVNGRISGARLRDALISSIDRVLYEAWLEKWLNRDGGVQIDVAGPLATVAICTRDRPDDLERCLHAVLQLPD